MEEEKPVNNSHLVIDNPESVNLVNPPTKITRVINESIKSSHIFNC